MKIGQDKLICLNTFDMLDTENFETYLSSMALKGWMITKIGKVFLTFEKREARVLNFFVDLTSKDLLGDNYIPTQDYIEAAKEENLEHLCGNEKFQVFINRGSKKKLDKKKVKLSKVFAEEFGVISNLIIAMIPFLISNSLLGIAFRQLVSSNFLLLWLLIGGIVILVNVILIIDKLIKYRNFTKEDNHSLKEVNNYKVSHTLNTLSIFSSTLFVIVALLSILNTNIDNNGYISERELPISLEDFNIPIQNGRESTEFKSSSILATYIDYSDYTYKKSTEEDSFSLTYSIFESKHDKIINKALNSILHQHDINYEKLRDKKELNYWKASQVYKMEYSYDRVVVYDDLILTISGDIDFTKANIDLIKNKLLHNQ